jgi:hypothetical protein
MLGDYLTGFELELFTMGDIASKTLQENVKLHQKIAKYCNKPKN